MLPIEEGYQSFKRNGAGLKLFLKSVRGSFYYANINNAANTNRETEGPHGVNEATTFLDKWSTRNFERNPGKLQHNGNKFNFNNIFMRWS